MIKSCSIFNFFHPAVWIIQDEKESDPMLIFLNGNRPLALHLSISIKNAYLSSKT